MSSPNPEFDATDVDDSPSAELRELIVDLMLAWPKLELGLTYWIAFALGVRASECSIILGAMDTRSKIDKLKALYAHRNHDDLAELLKVISKEHREFSDVRNTIAHAMLMGTSKTKARAAYFLTTRAVPDEYGFMFVRRFDFDSFKEAREFAIHNAMKINELLKTHGAIID
jgi:hypothetical protein